MSKKFVILLLIGLVITSSGCGQWNIFKWAHKEGAGSDATVLVADGQALLDKGDQASLDKAVVIFEQAMTANPKSSEANYGYARAVIAASGLGLADLISSVIKQAKTGTGSLPLGNPFINFVSPQYALSPLLDPTKLNLTTLYAVSKKAIAPLKRIADNETDGVIPADDFDVNFNLAFCLTIHSVCSLLDWDGDGTPGGSTDMINVTGDFKIKVGESDDLTTIQQKKPSTPDEISKIKNQVYTSLNEALAPSLNSPPLPSSDYPDNRGALYYLRRVLPKLASADVAETFDANIAKLANDTNTGITKLKNEISSW